MIHPLDRKGRINKKLDRLIWLGRLKAFRPAYLFLVLAVLPVALLPFEPKLPGETLHGAT